MFNRAKALGILGSTRDADEAYSGAARTAYGSDVQAGHTYCYKYMINGPHKEWTGRRGGRGLRSRLLVPK